MCWYILKKKIKTYSEKNICSGTFLGNFSSLAFNSTTVFSGNLKACFILYFHYVLFPALPVCLLLPLPIHLPCLPPIPGKKCSSWSVLQICFAIKDTVSFFSLLLSVSPFFKFRLLNIKVLVDLPSHRHEIVIWWAFSLYFHSFPLKREVTVGVQHNFNFFFFLLILLRVPPS